MSKHDNDHDDVPIVFAEPIGRTRIPRPVNQPNWRYNNNPRATKAGIAINWIGLILIIIITGMMVYIAISTGSWIAWVAAVLLAVYSCRSYVVYNAPREKRGDLEESSYPSQENPAKREKKYPKHRKDYR